jgi:uncharacterized protein YegP (UPF0339 family)
MRVVVFRSEKNLDWYFRVLADNNEIVANSEGYERRIDAVNMAKEFGYADEDIVIEDADD